MTRRSSRIAALAITCTASLAHAEHAQVALSYNVSKAPAACPDEATFRSLVAARLGYDPFVDDGDRFLGVSFERRGGEVTATLSTAGRGHEKPVKRVLRSEPDECFELATSLALIAAVGVDPDAMQARAEPAPPTPLAEPASSSEPAPQAAPSPPKTPEPPGPTPPVAPRAKSRRSLRVELAALAPLRVLPALRGGVRVGAHLGSGAWSIGAEAAFLFPSARDNPTGAGRVSAYVIDGALVPCLHPVQSDHLLLDLCAVGAVGALRSTAKNVSRAAPATDWFASVGPRAGFVVLLSRGVGLGASADLPVAISRAHLYIEDFGKRQEVWAAPRVGFIGAVSLVARFD